MSRAPDLPPAAEVLDNWFPTATGVVTRRGTVRKASITDGASVKSMFSYISGAQTEIFAANDSGIRDLTVVADADAWVGPDVLTGQTSGDWSTVQFATTGGEFMIGVNGADDGFVYNGSDFYPLLADGVEAIDFDAESSAFTVGETLTGGTSGATGEIIKVTSDGTIGRLLITNVSGGPFQDNETITDGATGSATADGVNGLVASGISFPSGSTLTTADLSYVWVYRQRIWFIEKDSLNAWYLPVDQVGGELTLWPMGGVFVRGGALTWGHTWSLDAGGFGGLSEQCVFTTTEGEVAAYQGLSPEPDQGWYKVGVYRIGKPMGKHGFFRAGGDLVIATSVGLISLATASKHDYAALGQGAVSYPVEDLWGQLVDERGQQDWRCEVWPDGQMAIISPPYSSGKEKFVLAVNVNTGKWARFTGWDARSVLSFDGGLYFGSTDGAVRQAWVGGTDEGAFYIPRVLPLFSDLGAPASMKVLKMARAVTRSAFDVSFQLSGHADFKENFPPPPNVPVLEDGSEWGVGKWGTAKWGASRGNVVTGDWVSVSGYGHDLSIGGQVTSNSTVAPDLELIRIDATYSVAEAGT